MHRAQHIQHAVHDAGVCAPDDRLARQTGQGGYSLHLVHLAGLKSSLINGESEGGQKSLGPALEKRDRDGQPRSD